MSLAAWGGKCQLWHVRLLRDVYYTWPRQLRNVSHGPLGDYIRKLEELGRLPTASSSRGTMGHPIILARGNEPDMDEFFVLGDNSPQSLDGRVWSSAAPSLRLWRKDGKYLDKYQEGAEPVYKLGTVPRYNLIGKALFVYWPSGFTLPGLPHLRLVPNVGRMRFIR